ncbi:MAG: FtsX-like permease family protein, partial [Dokdonella sp.]
SGQAREIGVMKTLGARVDQIATMYLAFAALLGLLASMLAVPVAIAIGRPYAGLKADMLNFSIDGYAIPWWAIALQLLVGCLLPIAAAVGPILRACRRPVAVVLHDPGIAVAGGGFHVRRWIAIPGIGRPLQLSIGNAFRQRQRMLLTVLALSAGGAVYIGADNLRSSVRASVDLLFASQRYDVALRFAGAQDGAAIEAIAARVAGVERAQGLASVGAQVANADGMPGDAFALLALPDASPMLVPTITAGRWLNASDRAALVVSRALMKDEPALLPGASPRLLIDGRPTEWTIVGIIDAGPQKLAYAPLPTLDERRGDTRVSNLLVAGGDSSAASALDLIARLRAEFDRAGVPVAGSQFVGETRRTFEDHLLMVVQFLGVMGWVMIAVGGMGLASTMSLAVLERTREIGVLRAIGARHATITRMIQAEGIVIAALAWLVALPLSVPVSVALANAFGKVMFTVPTHVVPDAGGVFRWLSMSVFVSVVACAWPARRATRIPTAAALGYT